MSQRVAAILGKGQWDEYPVVQGVGGFKLE